MQVGGELQEYSFDPVAFDVFAMVVIYTLHHKGEFPFYAPPPFRGPDPWPRGVNSSTWAPPGLVHHHVIIESELVLKQRRFDRRSYAAVSRNAAM